MIPKTTENTLKMLENSDKINAGAFCKDFIRGSCTRENCRFIHELPPQAYLKDLFRFCHDFQNKGCFRANCKFIHSTNEAEYNFYETGIFPRFPDVVNTESSPAPLSIPPQQLLQHLMIHLRDEASPPEAKLRRFTHNDCKLENQVLANTNYCPNCETMEHKVKLLHENINILLKKVADLNEKNIQLTSMNEFLLVQTASVRDQPCVITSRHCTSAPVSLATVSVTPIVSLAGALPALVPTAATPNLTLAPASSRAQLLTPAPQILTVSTTQQLVGNSGALIVTSAGAQQLMQVSDSGTLMGGGTTVVAMPAQLTLGPSTQQLIGNASQTTVQQLVQTQLAPQHQAQQFAAQQSVQHLAQQSAQHLAAQQSAQHLAQHSAQHLAAQQSAQHLAAQHSAQHLAAQQNAQHMAQQSAHLAQHSAQHAQHLAAQQSAQLAAHQTAQHLAAQQSAQHLAAQQSAQLAAQQSAQQIVAQQSVQQQLAAQQSAQQQLVPSAQQLVHQTSTQQISISSTSQPMALSNSQAQPMTFPMISQSILPH